MRNSGRGTGNCLAILLAASHILQFHSQVFQGLEIQRQIAAVLADSTALVLCLGLLEPDRLRDTAEADRLHDTALCLFLLPFFPPFFFSWTFCACFSCFSTICAHHLANLCLQFLLKRARMVIINGR